MATLVAAPLKTEASTPLIAVAANFSGAMERIGAAYEKETGERVRTVYAATGKLYAQIKNGAPYDIFLAADGQRPELLAAEGFCREAFVYATGQAVLWTGNPALAGAKRWQDAVNRPGVARIAIPAPEAAPYGAAALAAIRQEGLFEPLENKLVYGQNVAQPLQFAYQGAADLGFTALSLALSDKGKEGHYWLMPQAPVVVQKACVVKASANLASTTRFLGFFRSPVTAGILAEFGYR